ncbi:sigma factor-like helix-turn-helix DNA-binding protein [Leadbetterella sp. DM7]|uniref:sigma factor-like helix-turn-helix DNA-binding protein n=1 Tax=Leadbetterella sp. DM7 TaxID=3235085 RepID=UPI00349E97BE
MTKTIENTYLNKLKSGDEAGLTYFYSRFYQWYAYRAYRYIREDLDAHCATQEAFLRLWIFRENIEDVAHLHRFISGQVKEAGRAYHSRRSNQFRRKLLWFFDYDEPESLLPGEPPEWENGASLEIEEPDEGESHQLEALNRLLPHLGHDQQLFIRLCLKYDFNYERIAFYLGGIREYEVARRVNKCIEQLKSLLADSRRLSEVSHTRTLRIDRQLSTEQADILRLRYELGNSFEEIATRLGLSPANVRTLFIQAFTTIKHGKSNPHKKNSADRQFQG